MSITGGLNAVWVPDCSVMTVNTEKKVEALSVMTSSTVILVLGRLVRVTDDKEEQA